MGLFPEATTCAVDNLTTSSDVVVVGTPKGRRKLFVDILSMVGGGSTPQTPATVTTMQSKSCTTIEPQHHVITIDDDEHHHHHQRYPGTEGFVATATTMGRFLSSHSAQQLSTSWEFLR